MDPVSAFSLAAGILQVVGFGVELIRTIRQVRERGTSEGHAELETIGRSFMFSTDGLKRIIIQSPNSVTVDESVRQKFSRIFASTAAFYLVGIWYRLTA